MYDATADDADGERATHDESVSEVRCVRRLTPLGFGNRGKQRGLFLCSQLKRFVAFRGQHRYKCAFGGDWVHPV
jgi:hypothetical protein